MNKQCYNVFNVNENDFRVWCDKNNKPHYKTESKREFFLEIFNNKVKDTEEKK